MRLKNRGLGIDLVLTGLVIRSVNMNLVQMFIDVVIVIKIAMANDSS